MFTNRLATLAAAVALVTAVTAAPAHAVPVLQLYVPSLSGDNANNYSYYDYTAGYPTAGSSDEDSWVRVGESGVPWQLTIAANSSGPGAGTITSWDSIRLVASWMGSPSNALDVNGMSLGVGSVYSGVRYGGSYFGGTDGYVDLPTGVGSLAGYNSSTGIFSPHAPFGSNTAWAEINLGALGPAGKTTICDYAPGVDPTTCGGAQGWLMPLDLITNGLAAGTFVHFDVWGIANVETTSGGKFKTIVTTDTLETAPYSHDARWAQAEVDVPAPAPLALLGLGLLGIAVVRRRITA